VATETQAEPKAAVSLPKGGGAIRAIGEKFAANPVTGAGSLTFPLGLPEARANLGTDMALTYDSTASNGPFGFGWHLRVPEITRKTDKGVPRYGDEDVFILSGTEDLVAAPGPDVLRAGYAVRRYRPRIEAQFDRIERWTRVADGDVHWRTISRDNVMSLFGFDPGTRVADPASPAHVFSWLIHSRYDDRGNAVRFEYAAEDASNVDLSQAHERNRTGRTAGRYLKRIHYGNRKPLLLDTAVDGFRPVHVPLPDLAGAGWMFEIVLDYGEGHFHAQPPDGHGRIMVEAKVQADGAWPVRSDPFSRYRAGFEVRAYRLCRGVLVFHRFPDELGTEAYLAKAHRFTYDEKPYGSFLREMVSGGYVRQPDGRYLQSTMPPVTCDYTTFQLGSEVAELQGMLSPTATFEDVDGEGIAGALHEQAGTWLYQANLGGGRLAQVAPLSTMPAAVAAPAAGRRLLDVAGDGSLDLVALGAGEAGFYERTGGGWESLRTFDSWPRLSWLDSRFVDLTGDGLADILVARGDHLIWHGSLGERGFSDGARIPVPADEEAGPAVVFADASWSVHLADLSGDGMPDIVRIRNRDVCYWPNLGYGRFGAKVTMDNSPSFDTPDRFDARRIRFGDMDGTGVADMIYLGAQGAHIYQNEAGNRWSPVLTLAPLPSDANAVQVADLLGRGTACLVWSTPQPGAVHYIDLMSGHKPHLLNRVSNGMGAEVAVEYASSTEFYLADKVAGTPWATKLPFPVHVVRQIERIDHIGQNRYVSRYAYHDGYFDGVEREWRGFGRVDRLDTEEFADAAQIPPAETRTWYHTGGLASANGSALPLGLSAQQSAEARRALKGQVLRREVYARDGTGAQARPYVVEEHTYTVKSLQPRSFLVHPRETVEQHHERTLADPRIKHELTLQTDDYGSVLLTATVAYGRQVPDADPRLTEADRAVQAKTLVSFTSRTVTQPVDTPDCWRTPLPAQTTTYQLQGSAPADDRYRFGELQTLIGAAPDVETEEADGKRRLKAERILYRRNDLTAALALGQMESLALPHDSYKLALTANTVAAVYGPIQDAVLTEGGLVRLADGPHWWVPASRVGYSADPTATPAAELTEASLHFFRERRRTDPFGSASTVDYDTHDLFIVEEQDAVDNVSQYVHNYRVLKPASATDPNRNRHAVAYDALGMVVGTALMGKPEESIGDSFAGFVTDLTESQIAAHLADPRSGALALLGRATSRSVYDVHAFTSTGTKPVVVSTLTRETHDSDPGGNVSPVCHRLSYTDGLGNLVQEKIGAEQGQWITTGWVVLSNKGNPVRKYEPFFSATHEFTFADTAGVSPVTCYDPLQRAVAVISPNRSWRKVVFDPWRQELWDVNDTTLIADPSADPDVGGHVQRLPTADYLPTWHASRIGGALGTLEQQAAEKAAKHAETPTLVAVDPLGRTFLTIDISAAGVFHRNRIVLDIEGNHRAVIDAQGRTAAQATFDALGNQILNEGMDSGSRRTLRDAKGQPIREWDARGHVLTTAYDPLRRVLRRTVRGSDSRSDPRVLGRDVVYEQVVYGEGQPGDQAGNLRTRVAAIYDGAGIDRTEGYDFKGNVLHQTRTFTARHRDVPDWAADPVLENNVWHNRATFDAFNRPVTMTTADGSVTRISYSARGLVSAVDVTLRGSGSPVTFVSDITYNAKGQETKVSLGNGVVIGYGYDPQTFRPSRVIATRPSVGDALAAQLFVDASRVQDLNYTYDPAGNIVRLADDALRTVFHQNAQVQPISWYSYDSLYRLADATGREQSDQALRAYTEQYTYDLTSNLKSLAHIATGGGFTRAYSFQSGNRLSQADSETYTYDEHGALSSTPQLPMLQWDFTGRLCASSRQVVTEGGGRETTYYAYSSTGQRLRKVTERPNETVRCARLYLRGSELYQEFAGDGVTGVLARDTLHVMAASRRVALVDTVTNGVGPAGAQARFQLGNHLDSAVLELDSSGGLITYEEYLPYGATAYQTGRTEAEVSLKRFRYTGRERDEETGFSYHGARYYAPWLARWTACDPAGLIDGANLYQYAHSNPVRLRDPGGTQAEEHHRVPTNAPPQKQTSVAPVTPAAKKDAEPAAKETSSPDFLHRVTKVPWHRWPGSTYDPKTGDLNVGFWGKVFSGIFALAYIGLMAYIISQTARKDRPGDPEAYNYIKYGFTAAVGGFVLFRLTLEFTVSKENNWDEKFGDPWWTSIHTSVGVLMGIWQVPFPLVALSTILWEGVEITFPGFGDKEINGNRMTDIGVAWAGWLVAASITAWQLHAPFPHGFVAEHYTGERGQGPI
jgi:RHS repeat-associated protein